MLKKMLLAAAVVGGVLPAAASYSRVETMGGAEYFMAEDYTAIFRNPALVSSYGRYLFGDLGMYHDTVTGTNEALELENSDPIRPFFGATYYMSQNEDSSGLYVGAAFNRYDRMTGYVLPGEDNFIGFPRNADTESAYDGIQYMDNLRGKIDLLTAYRMKNGWTLGLSGYLAMQDSTDGSDFNAMSRVANGRFGVSGEVADKVMLDASVSVSALTLDGYQETQNMPDGSVMDNDIAYTIDARLLAALDDYRMFIPHIQANVVNFEGGDERIVDFNAGFGMNTRIDRGNFWAGMEGFYQDNSSALLDTTGSDNLRYAKLNEYGGKVMVGIERNMLTEWLVWRAGAHHKLSKVTYADGNEGEFFAGSADKDKYGKSPTITFGLGLAIEDRLFVDAVVAEDLFYTFSNLVSGNMDHLSTRISARFEF
ncbi:MAG: hypothetical protein ACQEQV_03775 [Fibrobacterota bacterium]